MSMKYYGFIFILISNLLCCGMDYKRHATFNSASEYNASEEEEGCIGCLNAFCALIAGRYPHVHSAETSLSLNQSRSRQTVYMVPMWCGVVPPMLVDTLKK